MAENSKPNKAKIKEEKSRRGKGNEEKSMADKDKMGWLKLNWLKAACKVGIIDKHELEPNFERNMNLLERYEKSLKVMYAGCESLIQPNSEFLPEHSSAENTHIRLATYLEYMKDVGLVDPRVTEDRNLLFFFNNTEKNMVNSCICLNKKLAKTEKEYREQAQKYTRDTMEFLHTYPTRFLASRQKMKECLLTMDDLALKVRKANTNEQVKEVGPKYEEAVNAFNRRAIEITDFWIYNYPKYNYQHQRDLIKYHVSRSHYHKESARMIRDWLAQNDYQKVKDAAVNPSNTFNTKTTYCDMSVQQKGTVSTYKMPAYKDASPVPPPKTTDQKTTMQTIVPQKTGNATLSKYSTDL